METKSAPTTNKWVLFNDAVPGDICEQVIELANDSWDKGGILRYDESPDGLRDTDVCFTSDQRVFDLVWPFMEEGNNLGKWNYDIELAESIQIGKYDVGQHYGWHIDGLSDHDNTYEKKGLEGLVRKLSMSILLSDDYEGGDLQFSSYGGGEHEILTPELGGIGSVILFPSYYEHRVTPVTKGTRYSLVSWFVGQPLR